MIDAAALLAHDFGDIRQSWVPRDAILYALGVGLGADPAAADDLAFLDERRLSVLPSFAVTLASPGMWVRDPGFGVDFAKLVHSAQDATFHAPFPAAGEIVGTACVASLTDRGEGRGAELIVERTITDATDGTVYCTLRQTLLLRGDGGFGGPPAERARATVPDRPPDRVASVTLSPRAALIYRLSGDWNPLHIDPAAARAAGFDRPIMHGLGVYGAVAVAACRAVGALPTALHRLACRFAGIVVPGDTIDLSLWRTPDGHAFTASRGTRRVLDCGLFEIA